MTHLNIDNNTLVFIIKKKILVLSPELNLFCIYVYYINSELKYYSLFDYSLHHPIFCHLKINSIPKSFFTIMYLIVEYFTPTIIYFCHLIFCF